MTANFWLDRPTLVTGATGLLGGWLVKRLLAAGANLTCLVRDWVPQSHLIASRTIDKVTVVRGDVRDFELVQRILVEGKINTVFHLAAQTLVDIANSNPFSTFETNVRGTWVLLEACRHAPSVKQVVSASSDKAYGEQEQLPYHEDAPLMGRFPYDASKSCADLIAQSYAASFGVPVAITRCGNFYGGGDLNWSRIVPGTIRAVLRGERPLIRSDGRYVRDYFYVEDAAVSYMLLAEKLAVRPDLKGQAFNFSNETRFTVLEIAHKILSLMNATVEPDIRNEAACEIRSQYLDAEKARRELGWRPLFTIEEGLAATIAWYREFFRHGEPG